MDFKMAIKVALKNIRTNKMRTFLTMLGIIIGVSAVIILVSVAQGTTENITKRIESLGTNLLSISIRGRGTEDSISMEEIEKLKNKKGIDSVAPVVNGNVTVKYETETMDVTLEGVDQNYSNVRNHHSEYGRAINPIDVEYRQKIVLLGSEVKNELFGDANPIGEKIQINGNDFKVVGVLEEKGSSLGGNNDEKILIPISTAQRFLRTTGIRNIYIQATSADIVEDVQVEVENFLLKKFNNDEDAYRVFNQAEMLSTMGEVTNNMTMMLGGIAAISLLVGGIGIMNIMLVSVTERTREIGIRKAIGAKRKDILIQFLLESAVISGLGGLIGVLLGIGGSDLLTRFFSLNTKISPFILIISYSFSIIVGMFFGIYPASKASKLKPVDALRFE
ncbi:MAG: putative transport system permease protein [Candidatus Petromonas sp.]|jgi:putative ABC transport system permease protein|nr:putative transport system permease protein [Candidatus Petromonas sp.]